MTVTDSHINLVEDMSELLVNIVPTDSQASLGVKKAYACTMMKNWVP